MGHFSTIFDLLMRNVSLMKEKNWKIDVGREAAESLAKEAKGYNLILSSPGNTSSRGSIKFASVFSRKGKKGVNQDCFIVWKVCQLILNCFLKNDNLPIRSLLIDEFWFCR